MPSEARRPKKKRKNPKTPIVHNHHTIYGVGKKQPDVINKVYAGEHWIISQRNRRKNISKGFCRDTRVWLALNEHRAVELNCVEINNKNDDATDSFTMADSDVTETSCDGIDKDW